MSDPSHALALDIGGTKVAVGVVDRTGVVSHFESFATAAPADGEGLFDACVAALSRSRTAAAAQGITPSALGVGCGGPMLQGGRTVSPLNIGQWNDFPLLERLESAMGLPTRIDNDAKAIALAEWRHGAGRGIDNFVGMVVSTGIGGGVILDGRLLDGVEGNAGHIGHVIVEPEGRICPCGAQGCVEAEASGTAIHAITGRPAAEADLAMRMRTGTLVGRAIASAVSLLAVERVAVGGSVALGYGDVFFTAANAELSRRTGLAFTRRACIVAPQLGPSAPLVGAAEVAFYGLAR